MLRFWRNPEFVRHWRAELRSTRRLTVLVLVGVICMVIGIACWISNENQLLYARRMAVQWDGRWKEWLAERERQKFVLFWHLFYQALVFIQAGVLTFWSLLSCAQSISGERERHTWDFQRTTRLTPFELLIGKTLGPPLLGYFIVMCCLPITLVAGFEGGVRLLDIVSAYLLIVGGALFLGLGGLWLSGLMETRSRGIGLIGALGLYAFTAFAYGFVETNFPGFGAFSPLAGLFSLLGADGSGHKVVARLFGVEVSWLLMSLVLYFTFGMWLVVMIVQNIKRDYDDVRPLSRWQAVGCAGFVNFMMYLVFYPRPEQNFTAPDLVNAIVMINTIVLFAIGLATLTPHERLKVWHRQRAEKGASLFSEDGLPWPWVVLSAVTAYALLVWGLFAWRNRLPFEARLLNRGAVQLLVLCTFIVRDVLFIQWCRLTKLRAPVIKGFLLLCFYYATSGVIIALFAIGSEVQSRWAGNVLTPAGVLDSTSFESPLAWSILLGLALQLTVVGLLLRAIARRLGRPLEIQAEAAA
jgi:hypothetical protein